ncbi:hypothetical protein JB92DRAFT_3122586 [Gautieria morchelliformis]|nr:hypothetical protein JB92DRAFT_3122586 [Gautieria morchelliformis]
MGLDAARQSFKYLDALTVCNNSPGPQPPSSSGTTTADFDQHLWIMLSLAMLGDYVLAGLELLRSLPVTSFLDAESLGFSFYIHPGACLARVNGRFVQLPCPPKTTYQIPCPSKTSTSPSIGALHTCVNSATFSTAAITSQSSTGALVAVNLLVILWLLTLLALSLTYKPVRLVVLSAKSAITTSSNVLYADILFEKIVIPYADIVLVIAASPAVFVAGVLIVVLLGFIKPTSDIPPGPKTGRFRSW